MVTRKVVEEPFNRTHQIWNLFKCRSIYKLIKRGLLAQLARASLAGLCRVQRPRFGHQSDHTLLSVGYISSSTESVRPRFLSISFPHRILDREDGQDDERKKALPHTTIISSI